MKKATSVSVGETHLLFVSSLYHPGYLSTVTNGSQKLTEVDELREGFMFDDMESEDGIQSDEITNRAVGGSRNISEKRTVPSLKSLCERMAAVHLVEPRNAIQVLEIADSLGADDLKKHCEVFFTTLRLHCLHYLIIVLINAEQVVTLRLCSFIFLSG